MKEEFKLFVRKKPELIKYVNKGDTTWQKIYEQWSLYGEDENIWKQYGNSKEESSETNKSSTDTLSLAGIVDMLKKVDMASVQKGVNSLQKMVELLQGFTSKDDNVKQDSYKPRQLFKKFED